MRHIDYALLEKFLSHDRLSTYLRLGANSRKKAVDLYFENLNQCQIFHTRLHWLEIGLRNTMNRQLVARYGNYWFDSPAIGLGNIELQQIRKAHDTLTNARKPISNASMVAAINFGLWVNLFNNPYENLWRTCLRKAFPGHTSALQRKELRMKLHPILRLRNRIAHYEPILTHDLAVLHQDTADIIGWIEPNMPPLP